MKILLLILTITISSCQSSQGILTTKNQWNEFVNFLEKGQKEEARSKCTKRGWESMSFHFDLDNKNNVISSGMYLSSLPVLKVDSINGFYRLLLDNQQPTAGPSSVIFILKDGTPLIDEFLPAK